MSNRYILDFKAQANQMLEIVESRLVVGQREAALELLTLKFKVLYEQGVSSGQLYESRGAYPFTAIED
ncbi:MAG: hypothetical protein CMF48_02215 [Legionellales bacterium]|nr:hypothetical protein [Legionellales bacterium]|tara:strand:+ start:393 stop:596 length:204 start_codon:yes stop_codon:yes gene_type:complete